MSTLTDAEQHRIRMVWLTAPPFAPSIDDLYAAVEQIIAARAQQIAARLDDGLRAGIEALADELAQAAADRAGATEAMSIGEAAGLGMAEHMLRTLLDQTRTEADR